MLRTVLRAHHLRPPIRPLPRSLVSSVLLTRTYENESVAELRKLAKDRGLSPKGNKSTLITRIQDHEQHKTIQAVSSAQDPLVPAGVQARRVSSASLATSGSEASSPVPGLPQAAQQLNGLESIAFTNVNLPDLSQPDPELPTPIPFYPDFYDSVHHPTPYRAGDHSTEPSLPKVLVLSANHDNLHEGQEPSDRHKHEGSLSSLSRLSTPGGSILQAADDTGMPTMMEHGQVTASPQAGLDFVSETAGMSNTRNKDYSRKLDKDEARGVWVLVGLLAGSWVLGGIVNGAPKKKPVDH